MTTAIAAWSSAEQRCFQYFVEKLESIEDVTGYIGELPITLTEGVDPQMWSFEIGGGSDNIHIGPAERPLSSWQMDAYLRGVFTSRETAQLVAGMAMTALPAGESDISKVGRLDWVSMPALTRTTIEMGSDQSAGGLVRVWLLDFPLRVLFYNAEYS